MPDEWKPTSEYRAVIDRLVKSCREGQGQIARRRVIDGVWNANADSPSTDAPEWMRASIDRFRDEGQAANALLARLAPQERQTLADLLEKEFVSGVHEALVVLYEARQPPFDGGIEGTPFHDFVGRMDGWDWPVS